MDRLLKLEQRGLDVMKISRRSPSSFRERDVRAWLRDTWQLGISFVEYAQGGDAGVSDSFLFLPRRIVPCELKVADYKHGRYAVELRPGQEEYHKQCFEYGIPSLFLIGFQRTYVAVSGYTAVTSGGNVPATLCLEVQCHDDIVEAIDTAQGLANRPHLVAGRKG